MGIIGSHCEHYLHATFHDYNRRGNRSPRSRPHRSRQRQQEALGTPWVVGLRVAGSNCAVSPIMEKLATPGTSGVERFAAVRGCADHADQPAERGVEIRYVFSL
jgi:hypothetical protein